MSKFLTLEQVKLNLYVDDDDTDSLIEWLIDAAVDAFEQTTNRKLFSVEEEIPQGITNGIHATKSIIQGMQMLIGHWYKNRESVGVGVVIPMSTEWAWKRHRWYKL